MNGRTPSRTPAPTPDRRDLFLYWWPVTARLAGLGIALYEMLGEKVDRPSLLAFAGALIVAPNIFAEQAKRNRRREEE
jgi:predicted cobalt transporter CbtA